jgi:hypothetical protein
MPTQEPEKHVCEAATQQIVGELSQERAVAVKHFLKRFKGDLINLTLCPSNGYEPPFRFGPFPFAGKLQHVT